MLASANRPGAESAGERRGRAAVQAVMPRKSRQWMAGIRGAGTPSAIAACLAARKRRGPDIRGKPQKNPRPAPCPIFGVKIFIESAARLGIWTLCWKRSS